MSKIPSPGLGVASADLVTDREDIARKSSRLSCIEVCKHAKDFTALAAALQVRQRASKRRASTLASNMWRKIACAEHHAS